MKPRGQSKVDWWVGGAFLIGLGGVAMDAGAAITGFLILLLGLVIVIIGFRIRSGAELKQQRLEQLREAATILCRKLPSGMMLVDQNDHVIFANDQALALFEGAPGDFQGSPLARWTESASGESQTGIMMPTRCFRRANGTTFYAHVSEAPVEIPGEFTEPPLRILIISDISALVDMHHRVQQTERLRTAATMATQFAHEVRNPVAAISGSAQVLGKLQRQAAAQGALSTVSDSDRALLFECIVNESDRLDSIITKFLSVNEFSDQRIEELIQGIESAARPEHAHAKKRPHAPPLQTRMHVA